MELSEFLIDLDDMDSGKQMLVTALKILENRSALQQRLLEVRNRLAGLSAQSMSEVGAFFK